MCRRELERLRSNPRDMAVRELALAAVVRIGTNPRVFQPCPAVEEVLAFVDALRAPSDVRMIAPGPAALALEHGCEWWTTDSGFSRFPGLRWRNLIG